MDGKLYVVLDIDDTLLKNIKDSFKEGIPNLDEFETAVNIPGKTLVLRPHVREFMDYLFKNHYVSLWTWSDYPYALRVAKILTNGHPEMFKDILAEEDANMSRKIDLKISGKNLNYLWYAINEKYINMPANSKFKAALDKRNAIIKYINAKKDENGDEIYFPGQKKPLTGYEPCNTLLIDDADYNNNDANVFNLIQIKPFGGHTTTGNTANKIPTFDANDTELLKIKKKIEEYTEKAKWLCKQNSENHIMDDSVMKAGRKTRRHKRHIKKTRKLRRKI
jgi:hypothetical protein